MNRNLNEEIALAQASYVKANEEANIAAKAAEEANAKASLAGSRAIQAQDLLWKLKKLANTK